MNGAENDLRLIAVMRRYFAVREELAGLKSALEDKRKAAGIAVGEFYHVRAETDHAGDVSRTVTLRREMEFLMGLAEGWSRGDIVHLGLSAD
ncbi:hypothetical protein QA648_31505 (plasmid) [Rhizobium sp. CB3171]|uniref:hypothetical protein n=1 Tax=Rhizobium sp. CB3171 TaxID=3039157 RepID=UPI0024B0C6A1|nr:hypothetical protein [Rhizobium sp. CB3171]WFU05249.1 hypothetical protein QA648_31505 [Rhizobium sp. CB3171]